MTALGRTYHRTGLSILRGQQEESAKYEALLRTRLKELGAPVEFSPNTPEYRDKLAAAFQHTGQIRESSDQRERAAALRRGRGR